MEIEWDFYETINSVGWSGLLDFLFRKTLPFFWFPVNTVGFMLPVVLRIPLLRCCHLSLESDDDPSPERTETKIKPSRHKEKSKKWQKVISCFFLRHFLGIKKLVSKVDKILTGAEIAVCERGVRMNIFEAK